MAVLPLSQTNRVMGDLTGINLHPGTKHILVQRFQSFRGHLSWWVGAMGPQEGEIDLLGSGQAVHGVSFMSTQ